MEIAPHNSTGGIGHDLLTLLIANQGLQLLESVGRDYLSSSAEAEKAAEVLLPVISAAIKKQTASKQDLIDFLDKADDATLERYLNAASPLMRHRS